MTDTHMRLLQWLTDHEGARLAVAAEALGFTVDEVERLAADLVAAGMIERRAIH